MVYIEAFFSIAQGKYEEIFTFLKLTGSFEDTKINGLKSAVI